MGCTNSKKNTLVTHSNITPVVHSKPIITPQFHPQFNSPGKKIRLLIQNSRSDHYNYDRQIIITVPLGYNYDVPLSIMIDGKQTELYLIDDDYTGPIYVQLYYSYHGTYECSRKRFSNCKQYHYVNMNAF